MERRSPEDPSLATATGARGQSNVVVVDFSGRALPDLCDMDRIHRMVASNRLADIFIQLAGVRRDLDR